MSNDPAANLAEMHSYLDDARCALGPGHVVVDEMMLSDWCSALARAIGEADGSTLAGQQDAIALLRADIERLRSQVQSAALDYLALDGQASEALARAIAAEAEAVRLREALMKIADMTSAAAWAPATGDRWLDRIDETARAALGRQP